MIDKKRYSLTYHGPAGMTMINNKRHMLSAKGAGLQKAGCFCHVVRKFVCLYSDIAETLLAQDNTITQLFEIWLSYL